MYLLNNFLYYVHAMLNNLNCYDCVYPCFYLIFQERLTLSTYYLHVLKKIHCGTKHKRATKNVHTLFDLFQITDWLCYYSYYLLEKGLVIFKLQFS